MQLILTGGRRFHKRCFKCNTCSKKLDSTTARCHGEGLYCKQCHLKLGPHESPKIHADTSIIKPADGKARNAVGLRKCIFVYTPSENVGTPPTQLKSLRQIPLNSKSEICLKVFHLYGQLGKGKLYSLFISAQSGVASDVCFKGVKENSERGSSSSKNNFS